MKNVSPKSVLGMAVDPFGITPKVWSSGEQSTGKPVTDPLAVQQSEADVERKRLLQEQTARTRAARRGGYRALLSQMRFAPETGLQTTLGPQA